jgi:hypothetical protein
METVTDVSLLGQRRRIDVFEPSAQGFHALFQSLDEVVQQQLQATETNIQPYDSTARMFDSNQSANKEQHARPKRYKLLWNILFLAFIIAAILATVIEIQRRQKMNPER